jgi:hypothetical protein
LAALALGGGARGPTVGDAAFLVVVGTVYLIASRPLMTARRWGRALGMIVCGIETVPAAVLLYVLLVFSADPAGRGLMGQTALMGILAMPVVVLVVLWRHRPERTDAT